MIKKRIANIVFYRVFDENDTTIKATIFYADGTVANVDFERGIDACEEIALERNIQTKAAFKELINRDVVHAVTVEEFKENFNSYIPTEIEVIPEDNNDLNNVVVPAAALAAKEVEAINAETDKIVKDFKSEVEEAKEELSEVKEEVKEAKEDLVEVSEKVQETKETSDSEVVEEVKETKETSDSEDAEEVEEEDLEDKIVATTEEELADRDNASSEEVEEEEEEKVSDSSDAVVAPVPVVDADSKDSVYHFDDEDDEFDYDFDEDYDVADEKEEEKPAKKEGFFKRMWRKFKESHIGVKLTAIGLAILLACGLYSCHQHKSLDGEVLNSNVPGLESTDVPENTSFTDGQLNIIDVVNAHYYNDAAIKALFDRTSNETQKTAMNNVGLAMDTFNNNFASYYVEEGIDVRPALKFDEVVALQVAYNDYGRDELAAIFNGADIRSDDLSRSYKDASLQLMGAYAIENSEHPVDMSMLIEDQEGQDFYNRYHTAFLAAKEAEGDEKIRLVTEFYNMVHADFAIGEQERTEGISHAENYERIRSYQLSVAPMIAAGEIMWQNLDVDVTLNDSEIDFLNDLGLCNFADHTFERAETVALTHDTDKDNPMYSEYKDAFINYYTGLGTYYIDDEHRELTKLDSFQKAVNWHFEIGEWVYEGGSYTTTDVDVQVIHGEDVDVSYHEEVTTTDKPITDEAKAEVDAEIDKENEEAKRKAEEEAEKERQRLQQEEDQNAQQVEEEVRQDEQDLQERIDDANDTIDNGGTVNEDDLGHGVDFDDSHSDENGNLDPSVENITTDPTGDMTNEPLPDPNETGRDFDNEAESNSYSEPAQSAAPQSFTEVEEPVSNDNSNDQWVESVPVDDDYYYEDAWVEYEDAVDSYVESMSDDSNYGDNLEEEDVDAYQYQK